MKISAPQYKNVQSLGRANIGSVGAVAGAVSAKGSADRALANHIAKVGSEFIRREEKAAFSSAITDTKVEMDGWVEQNGVREFFGGDELKGRVDGVELSRKDTDQYGDEIDVPIKQIPAYKVYPQLLAKKLKGVMDTNAQRITNPIDRQAYVESRQVYNADAVKAASLNAARQQFNYQRKESDIKRKQALLRGDLANANFLASEFEGTEFEIKDRINQNRQGMEVYEADELIRIEDVKGMTDFLNYLRDSQYEEKGGPLTERKNIDLQNRLRSKIGSLTVKKTASNAAYKAEIKQKGQDFLAAQNDGELKSAEQVARMRGELKGVKLHDLDIDIRRAEKTAPVIDALKKMPAEQHEASINSFGASDTTKGDEAGALKRQLRIASNKIEKRINQDSNGFYQEEIGPLKTVLGQKGYWAESVLAGKRASNLYKVTSKPLSDVTADQLGKNFEIATTQKKLTLIDSVLLEVPEKADRDALFTQIDRKNNGNLNVYADMVERGDDNIIKEIETGNKLREDKTLGLIPNDLVAEINIKLGNVFKLNSELVGYREAVLDYYAKLTNDVREFNEDSYDKYRMDKAILAVAGNVVEYDDRPFLLPDNTLDADSFDYWVQNIPLAYLEQLGGVVGMDNETVMQGIRDGDITLHPSLTRGEYLLRDISGGYLSTRDTKGGKPANFTLKYDRNQSRDMVMPDEFVGTFK